MSIAANGFYSIKDRFFKMFRVIKNSFKVSWDKMTKNSLQIEFAQFSGELPLNLDLSKDIKIPTHSREVFKVKKPQSTPGTK